MTPEGYFISETILWCRRAMVLSEFHKQLSETPEISLFFNDRRSVS